MNDLLKKAVDYSFSCLLKKTTPYDSMVAKYIGRYRKKLGIQIKGHPFSESDPIAILGFLQRFETACDHNVVTKEAATWCFQSYLTGRTHSPVHSSITEETNTGKVHNRETVQTYAEVVPFILTTYTTDEVIADACLDVINYRQS